MWSHILSFSYKKKKTLITVSLVTNFNCSFIHQNEKMNGLKVHKNSVESCENVIYSDDIILEA